MPLVKVGMRWRVGKGVKIRIWEDNWLPTQSTFQVQSPVKILDHNAIVSELINHLDKSWDEEIIHKVMNKRQKPYVVYL